MMQRCSQVYTSLGTPNSGIFNLKGLFILTRTLNNILSQPWYTFLLTLGSIKFSLFSVKCLGVQVMRPSSSASENLMYSPGALFSALFNESPLNMMESMISHDSGISSRQFESFSTSIFRFLLLASSIARRAFSINPDSQYSAIYSVFRSAMAQSEALNILSKQSLTRAAGILQQDMIRPGKQANLLQQRSLVPQSLMGNLILLSMRSWVCW